MLLVVPPPGGHRQLAAAISTGAGAGAGASNSSMLNRTRRPAVPAVSNAQDSSSKRKTICTCTCMCMCSLLGVAGHIYVAKERYDAIGNRSNRVLSFERGEELEVFNPLSSAEWWEVNCLYTCMLWFYKL